LLHSSQPVLDQVVSEKTGSRTPFLFHCSFLARGWPIWVCYLATLLIVSAMLALGLALDEHFHGLPFLFLFFAIIISSGLFDRGSGAFAVLLSVFFANWFLMTPTGTIRVENTGDLIALSCFMALSDVALFVSRYMGATPPGSRFPLRHHFPNGGSLQGAADEVIE
jgi:K+-sensing histidine kinase KdpD